MTAVPARPRSRSSAIHKASEGWAAGIVLMREHLRAQAKDRRRRCCPKARKRYSGYFTGEIFGRARPENQRVLMLAALLPSVSARRRGGDVRRRRKRRWCSTTSIAGTCSPIAGASAAEPVYQFHGLFREFLLEEGRRRLPAAERRAALDRAAGQLVERGDFDAAAALYIEAQAWPALVGLALHAGRSLLAEGRGATLVDWLAAMPDEMREHEPRLSLTRRTR